MLIHQFSNLYTRNTSSRASRAYLTPREILAQSHGITLGPTSTLFLDSQPRPTLLTILRRRPRPHSYQPPHTRHGSCIGAHTISTQSDNHGGPNFPSRSREPLPRSRFFQSTFPWRACPQHASKLQRPSSRLQRVSDPSDQWSRRSATTISTPILTTTFPVQRSLDPFTQPKPLAAPSCRWTVHLPPHTQHCLAYECQWK